MHHPGKLATADDPYGEGLTSHPPKRTGHYDGQTAPTAGGRGLLSAMLSSARERRRRRISWLPLRVQSTPVTMTGSLPTA